MIRRESAARRDHDEGGRRPIAETISRKRWIRSAVGGYARSAVQGPSCSANVPDPITMASATARRSAITSRSAGAAPLITADDFFTPGIAATPSIDSTKFP